MSNDLTTHEVVTDLSLRPEQSTFDDRQRAVLAHMGVENAPEADLAVFAHVCKRSGLDPFARQIHMIGRNTKDPRTQQWVTKYTIQTGIDGFRLIGRRAANQRGETISIGQPEWADENGNWRPLWSGKWGLPLAARVTIKRNGEAFTAVAIFDEYKQTKRDGGLTSMWAQRPAGQLAKCAEALAWRMAFPQDLSGIYTDDEMGQADSGHHAAPTAKPQGMAALRAAVTQPMTDRTRGALFALMGEQGLDDADDQRRFLSDTLGREVESRASLTEAEAVAAGRRLRAWQAGEPGAVWVLDAEALDVPTEEPPAGEA